MGARVEGRGHAPSPSAPAERAGAPAESAELAGAPAESAELAGAPAESAGHRRASGHHHVQPQQLRVSVDERASQGAS